MRLALATAALWLPRAAWHVRCLCKLLTLAWQPTGELRPADWNSSSLTQLDSGGASSPAPSPSLYPCCLSLSFSIFTWNWFCLFIVKNCLLLFMFVLPLWLTFEQFEATLSFAWNWFYFTFLHNTPLLFLSLLSYSLAYIRLSCVFTSETATFLVSSHEDYLRGSKGVSLHKWLEIPFRSVNKFLMLHLNFCFLFPFMTTHPVGRFLFSWQLLCVNSESKLLLCVQLSTGYLISLHCRLHVHWTWRVNCKHAAATFS